MPTISIAIPTAGLSAIMPDSGVTVSVKVFSPLSTTNVKGSPETAMKRERVSGESSEVSPPRERETIASPDFSPASAAGEPGITVVITVLAFSIGKSKEAGAGIPEINPTDIRSQANKKF